MKSKLVKHQEKTFERDGISGAEDTQAKMTIRYDDSCGNGHNTFSMTGEFRGPDHHNVFGCCHDEISVAFPEYAKYIKWHLCTSDGPLYYIENTLWHASDKDCHGKRAGEPWAWDAHIQFGNHPITHKISDNLRSHIESNGSLVIVEVVHPQGKFTPNYTFEGLNLSYHLCPFGTQARAFQWVAALTRSEVRFLKFPTLFSEGKEPDVGAARSCAIWPDATLEQLTDEVALKSRLPQLLTEFKSDVEELGFVF